MSEPGRRVAEWFGTFADLGRLPLTSIPYRMLIERLSRDFPVTATSYNWREDGMFGIVIEPNDALDSVLDQFVGWEDGAIDDSHALLTWYATTRDPRPWSNGRVPTSMVSRRRRARCDDLMRPIQMEQQLSISLCLDGFRHRAFVLARGGRDFSDDDVIVAGYIQRGLLALDAQTSLLSRLQRLGGSDDDLAASTGLTGRELAVLQLLVDGCSTRVMGRRLGCSPRTVEKHLEHVYRKLGVRDRVNAIRMARSLGLRGESIPNGAVPANGAVIPTGVAVANGVVVANGAVTANGVVVAKAKPTASLV